LTLRRCLQQLTPELKVFGKPSRRSAFLEQMMALFDEFYAYDISPETLMAQVEGLEGATGEKLRDVALLFAAYDAKLHGNGMDARSRMQKLRDAMQESHYLDGKDLYLDGFSLFNRLEEQVVEGAMKCCHGVTVALLGEKHNDDLFRNAVVQRDRLVRLAAKLHIPCEIEYLTEEPAGALSHLEKHFFGSDRIWGDICEAITLYNADSAYQEVEWVAAEIQRLVGTGLRYREIGVSARNMEDYAPLLERLFHRHGIPAYVSQRSDILEKPVLSLLLGAVDAVTGGFEYEDVFRCLKTGMAGISEAECDLLENYVIRWQIRGRMWLSEMPWTANPEGYGAEMTEARQAQLDEINRIRGVLRQPLAELYEGLHTVSSATEKAKVVYAYLVESGVPVTLQQRSEALMASGQAQLAEEYAQLWKILCGVLDQFVEILGDTPLDGEEFARLLRLILTQYSVGTIPATLDQIKVSEITRNDRHSVKVLFLLGATDDALPSVSRERGILGTEERQMLEQRDILLSTATFDVLDNELQNIYACLAQPTERLIVSWPSTEVNGGEKRPSFVVERIRKLFPQVKIGHNDGAYRRTLPATALEQAADDAALWRYFAAQEVFAPTLAAMEQARLFRRGRLSPEVVHALYGRSIPMSASRMDKANSCHFSYFMQYGLRARERKAAGFEAPEIGTFIHYLLENVNREVQQRGGYQEVSREELRALVDRYIEEYAASYIDGYQQKSARFRYLFSRLRKSAFSIVEEMAEELTESDFRPIAFELGFGGRDGKIPAITVTEGPTELHVTGKVDRVDGWLHEGKLFLRVVDYKTGKKAFDLSDIRYGLGLQMLLYLFALEDAGQSVFGHEVVPTGVLYHPARDVILRMGRDASPEKIQRALRAELRRSGMVLSDPEILQAMEHSALESPCFLPISVKKDGTITGTLATTAQMGKLSRYVDKLLHDIAREIGGGNIDADPCSHGPQQSACTYCPYYAACYFDERRDGMRYLKKTDSEEFWQYVEKETEAQHGN